jgi:hypothetical protein
VVVISNLELFVGFERVRGLLVFATACFVFGLCPLGSCDYTIDFLRLFPSLKNIVEEKSTKEQKRARKETTTRTPSKNLIITKRKEKTKN